MKLVSFVLFGLALGIGLALAFFNDFSFLKADKLQRDQGITPQPEVSPASQKQTVTAGGKLSFVKYQLTLEEGWEFDLEEPYSEMEILTLTSGGYKISISQGASGGSLCIYPNDPPTDVVMKSEYAYFKDIDTNDGAKLRRSSDSQNSTGFTVCNKVAQTYMAPTIYGHISIELPQNSSQFKITEIDSILSSITKI